MAKHKSEKPTVTLEDAVKQSAANANELTENKPAAKPIDIALLDLSTEDSITLVGKLMPIAAASLEHILRNPAEYPNQAVQAAKLVLERKLGAVPDTVIQNNMQFIVKWED